MNWATLRLVAFGVVLVLVVLIGSLWIAFQVSPWPSALLVRAAFDRGALDASEKLVAHLPHDVAERLDVVYDPGGRNGTLDLFYPRAIEGTATSLPTIVWIHGGGWISGSNKQIDNYARILAARGFTVASVDYTIAPEAIYPTPVRQVMLALGFLSAHASDYHIDPRAFVLAGDSGGSQIAAQVANVISVPSYARAVGVEPSIPRAELAGTLLFCGAYDARHLKQTGRFASFLGVVLWAYSGTKNFASDTAFDTASVAAYVTRAFPPAFISAGNADPLLPQSVEFARLLREHGVRVETLFFPPDHAPPAPHEYQFDLDSAAGREALARAADFVRSLAPEVKRAPSAGMMRP